MRDIKKRKIKFCTSCGKEFKNDIAKNDKNKYHCSYCNQITKEIELEQTIQMCSGCGYEIIHGEKYCRWCGTLLIKRNSEIYVQKTRNNLQRSFEIAVKAHKAQFR